MKRQFLQFITPVLFIHAAAAQDEGDPENLWTGAGAGIGGVLFPAFNYQAAYGTGSMNPGDLATGHHDPNRHGITQQNTEFSLDAVFGDHLRMFGTYAAVIDHDDQWFGEFEEYYAVVSGLLPGATIKGGRFYTRFGYDNALHPHDYLLVDKALPVGRFIGEDSMTVYGAEISLPVLPGMPAGWDDRITISYGAVPDPAEEDEGEAEESRFEGEGALFQDWLATVDYSLGYTARKDTRYEFGVSGAFGKNNFERHSQLYGLHLDYLWRPDGVAGADKCCNAEHAEFLRWRTEFFLRRFGAANDEGDRDEFTDAGICTILSYGFPDGKLQAHLRGEYASGTDEAGLPERWRVSPSLAWWPTKRLPFHFKLQYNADFSPAFGNEHSVFLQFNVAWGGRVEQRN